MAEDINDTIHVIVDYRVGICPFNVNKWDVNDTLWPHGAAEVSFNLRNALNDCSVEQNVAGITPRICTTLENIRNISKRSFLCIVSSISGTVM